MPLSKVQNGHATHAPFSFAAPQARLLRAPHASALRHAPPDPETVCERSTAGSCPPTGKESRPIPNLSVQGLNGQVQRLRFQFIALPASAEMPLYHALMRSQPHRVVTSTSIIRSSRGKQEFASIVHPLLPRSLGPPRCQPLPNSFASPLTSKCLIKGPKTPR